MIEIIIKENERLFFDNSLQKVKLFLEDRINFFKILNHRFVVSENVDSELEKSIEGDSSFIVLVDIMNPFIDFDLLNSAIKFSKNNNIKYLKSIGHVGGTQYDILINNNIDDGNKFQGLSQIKPILFEAKTQELFNNQLNLYKFKRLKMFLSLIKKNKNLFKYTIKQLFSYLDKPEVYKYLISYAEKVKLENYKQCPHCSGNLKPLFNSLSQPMVGFVSSKFPHYHECIKCKLIVSTPKISPKDIHLIYDKWDKEDFVKSSNNPYHGESRRSNFENLNLDLNLNLKSLDLGGGEGNFSKFLVSKYPNWDVYHSDYSLKLNVGSEINAFELDFTNQRIDENKFNIITAWEVIEHVPYEKFDFVFNNIFKALKKGGYFIFSTPNFDSPLIKLLDFYSVALPFHYTILSKEWLDNYLPIHTNFLIDRIDHTSDFLDDYLNWFNYAIDSSKSIKEASMYELFIEIFNTNFDLKNHLLEKGIGTEIIYQLRKE